MSRPALEIHGLGKRYRIGVRESYTTLRDSIMRALKQAAHPWAAFRAARTTEQDFIWALKDISFSVEEGDILGIIGRNGAGKSTLLKVLSRITAPTEGYADVHGRVRSLLEVGTGFHPELTGRENIYLNGAILGMKKTEIQRKFDGIVAFAEVDKFIDTPVKRYSSGMYLRLAFAVAAHLTSEVLLVDEVLAVGDAAFQRKCLGKMGEVARQGRTVLFVSHNMAAIRALCKRGLLLEDGRIRHSGEIEQVLYQYTRAMSEGPGSSHAAVSFSGLRVNGGNPGGIASGESFDVECSLHVNSDVPVFRLFCIIQDVNGEAMVVAPVNHKELPAAARVGSHEIRVIFPRLWMRPGVYSVHFKLLAATANAGDARFVSDSLMLDVAGVDDPEMLLGYLTPEAAWSVDRRLAVSR